MTHAATMVGGTGAHPVNAWEPPGPSRPAPWFQLAVLALATAAGAGAALNPAAAAATSLLLAVAAAVWVRPVIAAYLVIGVTPLVAGIDRGVLLPALRPNEALELLLGAVLVTRGVLATRTGGVRAPRLSRVEWSLLLLALTSSVLPLATMTLRGRDMTADDVLSSLALWKLGGIYLIVRWSVRTEPQLRRCLHVSLTAAGVVAAVGILQGLDLLGVRQLLVAYYAPLGDTNAITAVPRGGSTLSLPAATADLLVMNLAVLTGLWVRDRRPRPVLSAALGALLVMATLAAGEFSSAIGLVAGVVTLVLLTRSLQLVTVFGVLASLGSLSVWPVIARRLQDFESASGLPVSWVGRMHNLRTYFWPHLESFLNVLLGVRPSARVPVDYHAAGYVWIESGYTWLVWAGGVPLVLSFLFFVRATVAQGLSVARRHDAAGAAGTAAVVGIVVITVLMTFDPHLTYRGSADALFAVLALTGSAARWSPAGAPHRDIRLRAVGEGGTPAHQHVVVRSEP